MTYFRVSGNPFVDAGIFALCELAGRQNPEELEIEDIRKQLPYLPLWYPKWEKIGNLFTINPKFRNPAIKNPEAKYKAFLEEELLGQVIPLSTQGSCLVCGGRSVQLSRVFREIHPLAGSGDLLNFFSFFEPGLPLCAACTLAIQFSPFYLISRNGRLALAHSPNPKFMRRVARQTVRLSQGYISMKKPRFADLDFKTRRMSDEEFVIQLTLEMLAQAEALYGPTSIRVYLLVNLREPALSYIDLPAKVFSFLEEANLSLKQEFNELLHRGSREICYSLINGQSLLPFFIPLRERCVIGGWSLLELYLKEVMEMETERLEVIKRTGDHLYQYLKNSGFRRLKDLEQTLDGRYGDLLVTLNRIQKEALIWEIEDIRYLFPQDVEGRIMWRETLSLLLGYIYEQMHKEGINPKEV